MPSPGRFVFWGLLSIESIELLVVAESPLRKPAGAVLSIVDDDGPVAQDVIKVMMTSARLAVTAARIG